MKKLIAAMVAISLTGLLPLSGCQPSVTEEHTLIPVQDLGILQAEQEALDDIIVTPGGLGYRAGLHQQGVENPWPPIEIAEVFLGSGSNEARISYRNYVEAVPGETRNCIIKATIPGREVESLRLYADRVPPGITLTDGMQWSGPGARASVLVIEIASEVAPGEYPLEIGLIINGKDYGPNTCTINVIPEEVPPPEGCPQ